MKQGTTEWREARRSLVTGTDIPVLLGLSPYRCEADLADEKAGGEGQESTLRMRIGSALQGLIGEEYERQTGRKVVQFHRMHTSPDYPWAAASLDFRVIGERRIVEAKHTTSRSRFADGVPRDIEAQVAWQLGVTGYPVADIAVMTSDDLQVYEQAADPALFADLVAVAEDFRRRLEAGGPFARDKERIKRDHPRDNGQEMAADAELEEVVKALIDSRDARRRMERNEEVLEAAIQTRMADYAVMRGKGWHIVWRQTKDLEKIDWKNIAQGLLNPMPKDTREAVIGLNTRVTPGMRPFRLVREAEETTE